MGRIDPTPDLPTSATSAHRVRSDFDPEAPANAEASGVLIVRERSSGSSAHWIPPIFLLLVGTLFLAYRSSTNDWQGLAALFDRPVARAAMKPVLPPAATETAPGALAQADPKPEPQAEETPTPADDPKPAGEPAAEAKPAPDPDDPVLNDIEAEAEKTRERIAELEKAKAKEAQRLEETEDERRRENDRLGRRLRFRFQGVPPEEIDRMIAGERERLKRQMAWMEEFQNRAMREMEEMQKRFMRDGFDTPNPNWPPQPPPGFAMPNRGRLAPLLPRAMPPGAREGRPEPDGTRVFRTPDGGTVRFRQFRGPGVEGFQMRFGDRAGAEPSPIPDFDLGDRVLPAPPRPLPRFD